MTRKKFKNKSHHMSAMRIFLSKFTKFTHWKTTKFYNIITEKPQRFVTMIQLMALTACIVS